jgi:hypothetical protein
MRGLYRSKMAAYAIQFFSTIIIIYALLQPISSEHSPLKQALALETIVQIVQIVVYTWLIIQFHLASMASIRYLDWVITTPLMLLAFVIYLNYESNEEAQTMTTFLKENKNNIYLILLANGLMLLFGFCGELGYISKEFATIFGFISLLVVFYIIYQYAKKSKIGIPVFITFASVWSFYGIAYNFDEVAKNITYNILDTIAKNAFGLLLSYRVLSLS